MNWNQGPRRTTSCSCEYLDTSETGTAHSVVTTLHGNLSLYIRRRSGSMFATWILHRNGSLVGSFLASWRAKSKAVFMLVDADIIARGIDQYLSRTAIVVRFRKSSISSLVKETPR